MKRILARCIAGAALALCAPAIAARFPPYAALPGRVAPLHEGWGHTDNVGKRDYNLKLSDSRVNAVRGWLVGKGIKADRVTAKGYADTQPVESNETPEGRARNRRVELKKSRCP